MENLLNTIFPQKCLFCGAENIPFCTQCLKQCTLMERPGFYIHDPVISVREGSFQRRLKVFAPFEYEGLVRNCIKRAKYGARHFSALKILSTFAANYSYNFEPDFREFRVIPIPISKFKRNQRGFNQAEMIAEIVSDQYGLILERNLLKRVKETGVQYSYDRKDRFRNVKDAFQAPQNAFRGKKVLLVDDICTSGATLLESARTLYLQGALEVRAWTLSCKT